MFLAQSLFTTLLLPISIAASPVEVRALPITLPLVKHTTADSGPVNLVQNDQARATALYARLAGLNAGDHAIQSRKYSGPNPGSIDASAGNLTAAYLVSVGVGSPPTTYNLMFDTASSNTWVGNNKPYIPTSTSKNLDQPIMFPSNTGFLYGSLWLDTLTLTPDLVVTDMAIGVASTISYGFSPDMDGILGVGPPLLTFGTYISYPPALVPTVSDNLFNQGMIPVEVVSFSLGFPSGDGQTNAEITFGGTDSSKYTGQITYTPILEIDNAIYFWSFGMSISYGDKWVFPDSGGLCDIATTLIHLLPDAYAAYQSSTGATEDEATNMLKLTTSQYDNLQNLNFNINSQTFSLVPNAQIWPRALNSYIGGSHSAIYLVVANQTTGNTHILGAPFFERFYTVLDNTRSRIGFATTSHTNSIIN